MAARLAALVKGEYPPGVYRWPSRAHPGALSRELGGSGWRGYELPAVTDSGQLLAECAEALALPGWFWHTWECLAYCLADLSWLPGDGHVLLWTRYGALANTDGDAWRQAYQTLAQAAATRIRYAVPPLYILLRGTGPETSPVDGAPIPVLPAVTTSSARLTGHAGRVARISAPARAAARVSGSAGWRPRRAR
jgi:hypothetical protein